MTVPEAHRVPEPDVLDLAVIDGLRELGGEEDPGLLSELIELFLSDAPQRLQELEAALEDGDLERLSRAAHTLKSSSANLGAVAFRRLCEELERSARQGDEATCRRRRQEWRGAYAALEQALARLAG